MTKEKLLAQALIAVGGNPSLAGFGYTITAVMMCSENPKLLEGQITKQLYPAVARKHGTTSTGVERSIRHLVSTIPTRHLTNGAFIGALVWFLKYCENPMEVNDFV